mmetsp:Transcript_64492/g.76377  ORF Transcript_64492/g.76377 Transcript_64492/m.76377 type:complete len:82 (+) Transcript_64492:215-460(+)
MAAGALSSPSSLRLSPSLEEYDGDADVPFREDGTTTKTITRRDLTTCRGWCHKPPYPILWSLYENKRQRFNNENNTYAAST